MKIAGGFPFSHGLEALAVECYNMRMRGMKKVGKRSGEFGKSPASATAWLSAIAALRKSKGVCPRGLYRFKHFEEADEWMNEMILRTFRGSPR